MIIFQNVSNYIHIFTISIVHKCVHMFFCCMFFWTCINCKKCFPFYNLTEGELFIECREETDNLNHSMCELLTKCRYFDNVMDDSINPSSEVNFDLDIDPDTNFLMQ